MIKSYRGKLADDTTITIPLHTNDGKTGYRIIKFELFPSDPTADNENVVKIYTVEPSSTSTSVDFEDNTLLGVGMWTNSATSYYHPSDIEVIFDNSVFNQDIFVSHRSSQGGNPVNYYIELEQVSLTEDQALVAIVKNLRNEQ